MSTDLPYGWQEVAVTSAERVVVRNGNVYFQQDGQVPLYLGRFVAELSAHEWVSAQTVRTDGRVRDEFHAQATSLADRPSEAEWMGLSARLEDDRYMRLQEHEVVCDSCFMVRMQHIAFCEWCS